MFSLRREMDELLKKYPDPRKGAEGIVAFNKRKEAQACFPRPGVVVDNKDPLLLGRVRVACDMIAPGAVTGWIQVVSLGAGPGFGWWLLPDIGTQVILMFLNRDINRPIVIGSIYDLKHRPPKHSTKNPADSIVWQTKNHRMEIIDEAGKEAFILSTGKEQIRLSVAKDKGIELVNRLGGIRIKCRKLRIKGEEVSFQAGKLTMTSEEELKVHGKNIRMSCEKEVSLKGKNVKLNASRGITTEGKQLAAEGDKVMGFDIHQMVVPSGSGTSIVPLPHPFLGKLATQLSNNVKINGHNAGTKGSVAKHDDPVHNQLPGTIKFHSGPKKEGEVTGGTGKTVKINGKEVAVVGSTVTTCNDIGAKDNSTVMAAGASMPMPVIINPKNTAEYLKEREEARKIHPEFTRIRWEKSAVKEGEEVEILAGVKDVADGNPAVFQVWAGTHDPATHIAFARVEGVIEGGSAKGKWKYRYTGDGPLPEENPKFFATVHSAWCPPLRGDMLEVELKRPELTNPEWKDKDGNRADKGIVGETLRLSVTCNADMEEGAGVVFKVYAEGADPRYDEPASKLDSVNKDGKAEAEWIYRLPPPEKIQQESPMVAYYRDVLGIDVGKRFLEPYINDYEEPFESEIKANPKFFFTAEARRAKTQEAATIELTGRLEIYLEDALGNPLKNVKIDLIGPDDKKLRKETDDEGKILLEDTIPGRYNIHYVLESEEG